MAKTERPGEKREKKKKSNLQWVVTIFFITIVISGTFSFTSSSLMASSSVFVAFLILLFIVLLGILFDIVGVAVTSAEERPFHSMAAKKVPGAAECIMLLRHADRVASICNDVIGDICGVVSGAAAATIAAEVLAAFQWSAGTLVSLAMSALVAGLTVGGKAVGKSVAMHSCTSIVFTAGEDHLLAEVHSPIAAASEQREKKVSRLCGILSILERIQGHEDLARLSRAEQTQLCKELRRFLVSHVAQTGGHLASNLGVVELSVALETVFDTRTDRLVFDVGHQSYIHKILTDRRDQFSSLRCFGGIAGFPKPCESVTDAFVAGHASNSVSVALGMARARTLQREHYSVLALIGDGATTGGLAYEGLNDAGASHEPLIVILNDNEMSIAQNVGGMAHHLSKLRTRPGYFGVKRVYRAVTNRIPGGKFLYRTTHRVKNWMKKPPPGHHPV